MINAATHKQTREARSEYLANISMIPVAPVAAPAPWATPSPRGNRRVAQRSFLATVRSAIGLS